jgi:hypothetical protein
MQPNWLVKRTPIFASKYWFPPCFALRCRLPLALGFSKKRVTQIWWASQMKNVIKHSAVYMSLVMLSHSAWSARPAECGPTVPVGDCHLLDVSMIELLANPERFHKKQVRVEGFLNLTFEGNALYLHKEDFEHSLDRNGLWLSVPKGWHGTGQPCTNKTYVLMEGVFNAEQTGHMGLWSGSLESVTRCESL